MDSQEQSFNQLAEFDRCAKPYGADEDWIAAGQFYEDRSRDETIKHLVERGVGLANNRFPLEVAMLRRIIDRLAVVYDSPPTRWLRKANKRLAESNDDHKAMTRALRRSQYDPGWKCIDQGRDLYRQLGVRYYPSDARGCVVLRTFEPCNIRRQFDPGAGDQIDADEQFALLLTKQSTVETWEWWKKVDGVWFMEVVNEKGQPIDKQPFASSGGRNPYPELPVQIIYDQVPLGRAWLPPRASRTAWCRAINAVSNDLWSLVVNQAHSRGVTKTDDPENVPTVTSHGGTMNLGTDEDFDFRTPNPKIAECLQVLEWLVKLWSLSEDLPAAEFDKSKQVLTGAALLVQESALRARREAQVPLAFEDERIAYRKYRAVHNLHTRNPNRPPSWDLSPLAEDTELQVEIADLTDPVDATVLQDLYMRDIAAGFASPIDYMQRRDKVSREEAVETYERVQEDLKEYPPGAIVTQDGPQTANPGEQTPAGESKIAEEAKGLGFAERAKKPSVVAAVNASANEYQPG